MSCDATEAILRERQTRQTLRLSRQSEVERVDLLDLIQVLLPYPGGLRRWSVMRAIRSLRENRDMEISPKFEDEIERVFRKFCAGKPPAGAVKDHPEAALFHRPSEKAGEVWAVNPNRARAWLRAETGMQHDVR